MCLDHRQEDRTTTRHEVVVLGFVTGRGVPFSHVSLISGLTFISRVPGTFEDVFVGRRGNLRFPS